MFIFYQLDCMLVDAGILKKYHYQIQREQVSKISIFRKDFIKDLISLQSNQQSPRQNLDKSEKMNHHSSWLQDFQSCYVYHKCLGIPLQRQFSKFVLVNQLHPADDRLEFCDNVKPLIKFFCFHKDNVHIDEGEKEHFQYYFYPDISQ